MLFMALFRKSSLYPFVSVPHDLSGNTAIRFEQSWLGKRKRVYIYALQWGNEWCRVLNHFFFIHFDDIDRKTAC